MRGVAWFVLFTLFSFSAAAGGGDSTEMKKLLGSLSGFESENKESNEVSLKPSDEGTASSDSLRSSLEIPKRNRKKYTGVHRRASKDSARSEGRSVSLESSGTLTNIESSSIDFESSAVSLDASVDQSVRYPLKNNQSELRNVFTKSENNKINTILSKICLLLESRKFGTQRIQIAADFLQELINKTRETPRPANIESDLNKIYKRFKASLVDAKKAMKNGSYRYEYDLQTDQDFFQGQMQWKHYDPSIKALLNDYFIGDAYSIQIGGGSVGLHLGYGLEAGGYLGVAKSVLGKVYLASAAKGSWAFGSIGPTLMAGGYKLKLPKGLHTIHEAEFREESTPSSAKTESSGVGFYGLTVSGDRISGREGGVIVGMGLNLDSKFSLKLTKLRTPFRVYGPLRDRLRIGVIPS